MPAATFYLLCDFGELFLLAPKYTHGRARNADIVTPGPASSSLYKKYPPTLWGGRYVLIIHFYVESGQKMIQFNIQFKIELKIFIGIRERKNHRLRKQ